MDTTLVVGALLLCLLAASGDRHPRKVLDLPRVLVADAAAVVVVSIVGWSAGLCFWVALRGTEGGELLFAAANSIWAMESESSGLIVTWPMQADDADDCLSVSRSPESSILFSLTRR